ncbi:MULTISPECIES: hypothetical protein [Gordonia]|uniref:Uncharacterized protein n=1 Tax=Gordonia sihwensis NBRC 108236 TaxID=1223544 RepID=L7LHH8_9ACTN|nr:MULTISPECIES: hypothetical protein [Gordonia]AUH69789.1 hypothetical protein CXX93_17640 [Gordonia sp. YC-JH1]GAC59498.1 hypothetical protein GSI01S_02_01410 [Gordonia sihwensis NBRC 108236]
MTRKRSSKPCLGCSRHTKSVTRYCADCRPAAHHPYVQKVDGLITFAGLTLTTDQARHLADAIHDTIEEETP